MLLSPPLPNPLKIPLNKINADRAGDNRTEICGQMKRMKLRTLILRNTTNTRKTVLRSVMLMKTASSLKSSVLLVGHHAFCQEI